MTIENKIYKVCKNTYFEHDKDNYFDDEFEAIAYCINNAKDVAFVIEYTGVLNSQRTTKYKELDLFATNNMGVYYYDKGKYTNKKCSFEIFQNIDGWKRNNYIDNVEGGKAIKIKIDTDFDKNEFEGLEIDGTKYLLLSIMRKTHLDYVAIPYVDGVFQSEGVLKFNFMGVQNDN